MQFHRFSVTNLLRTKNFNINCHQSKLKTSTLVHDCVGNYEAIPMKKHPMIPRLFNLLLSGGPNYLHEHCDRLHKELGPIFREQLGPHELVFLADTQLIQTVISHEGKYPCHTVPEAGEPWSRLRKAFNRVMLAHPESMTRFSQDILNISDEFLNDWIYKNRGCDSTFSNITIRDIRSKLCKWSIETTGFVLFGSRMGCVAESGKSEDMRGQLLVENVAKMFTATSKFHILPHRLAQSLRLPAWVRFEEASDIMLRIAKEFADQYIARAKTECKSTSSIVADLIQTSLLTPQDISRSIVDLIIAAADTTSNSMQWMLYLIARYPHVQSRLLEEVRPLFDSSQAVDWTNFRSSAPYLHAFIKEVSRLYPTAPFLARTLDHDITLNGFKIPAGKQIVFSLFTTSRMETYFSDPHEFRPERWLRDPSNTKTGDNLCAFASLPFGVGARMCIGRRAAELEMSLLVAAFVHKFNSKLEPDMAHIKVKLNMILGPDKPINLVLEPRRYGHVSR